MMLMVIRPAMVLFAIFGVITGLLYPLSVAWLGYQAYPQAVTGSLLFRADVPVGSALIGQGFSAPRYFWSRPSATSPTVYNAGASSGSNLAPSNPALVEAVTARIAALKAADPTNILPIPIDLVTTSASGLDPHISLAAARYQSARVARARGFSLERVEELIAAHTVLPFLGFLGEARVNVLQLNLALDGEK